MVLDYANSSVTVANSYKGVAIVHFPYPLTIFYFGEFGDICLETSGCQQPADYFLESNYIKLFNKLK
jgi:hypothetical protein